jgi:DNA damage-binding protein 1
MADPSPLIPAAAREEKRTVAARDAYSQGDASKSRAAHDQSIVDADGDGLVHPEQTLSEGRLVKPFVFGGLDGVSTVFAVLAGGCGIKLDPAYLIAMGVANVLAGAFSMAVGEYLSSAGERDVAQREMDRERWEVQNYPQGEIAEMRQLYVEKGLSREDADNVAKILSKYEDFWVEHMLLTEIGMLPPDDSSPLMGAMVMFVSFVIFGALPIVVFAIVTHQCAEMCEDNHMLPFYGSAAFTILSLFGLGAVKASLADQSVWVGALIMGVQGSVAGVLAYSAGNYFGSD